MKTANTITALLLFVCYISSAAGAVFVDSFNDGNAADSDSVAGFWSLSTSVSAGGANSISESGGSLLLSAGDNGTNTNTYSGVLLTSTVSSDFNFFDNTLTFQVRGISFSGTMPANDRQLRFGLNSQSGSSFNSPDSIVAKILGNGTFALDTKVDIPNGDSDGSGPPLYTTDVGGDNSVTGFDLTLGPGTGSFIDFDLTVFGGSGASTSGQVLINRADWGTAGNSSLMLWAQENNNNGATNNFSVTVDSLTVIPEPGTFALVLLAFGALLLFRSRRA